MSTKMTHELFSFWQKPYQDWEVFSLFEPICFLELLDNDRNDGRVVFVVDGVRDGLVLIGCRWRWEIGVSEKTCRRAREGRKERW